MKTILVLLVIMFLLLATVLIDAQTVKSDLSKLPDECKLAPPIRVFPDGKFPIGDYAVVVFCGTWMDEKKPYDPRWPNVSYITCVKREKRCHVATAYVSSNILNVIQFDYTVRLWTPEVIMATNVGLGKHEGRVTLTMRNSDKSVIIDRGTARRDILGDGSPLTNKSLQKFYGIEK